MIFTAQIRVYNARISEAECAEAQEAFCAAITDQISNYDLLVSIYADYCKGLEAGLDHFESGLSAWDKLEQIGYQAANDRFKKLGWPKSPEYSFDIQF